MAKLSIIQISGSGTYVQITDHASAPSPTANKLYANTTSVYWEDTDLCIRIGENARRKVVVHYTWRQNVLNVLNGLEGVATNG